MYQGPTVQLPGESSTRNVSGGPSDANAFSLSDMLDLELPEETLAKYFSTRSEKDGVLRRRVNQSTPLSTFLKEALTRSKDLKD